MVAFGERYRTPQTVSEPEPERPAGSGLASFGLVSVNFSFSPCFPGGAEVLRERKPVVTMKVHSDVKPDGQASWLTKYPTRMPSSVSTIAAQTSMK